MRPLTVARELMAKNEGMLEAIKAAEERKAREAAAAREAGVLIVTGDTKVVERGKGDGIFINTSGVGVVPAGLNLSASSLQPGDNGRPAAGRRQHPYRNQV